MIELYNVNDINLMNNNLFGEITGKIFFISSIVFIIFIILSLIIWRVGTSIKSEKVIKIGIKSFIILIIMQIFIMLVPILINFARNSF